MSGQGQGSSVLPTLAPALPCMPDPSQLGPPEATSLQGFLRPTAGPWTLENSLSSKEDIRERALVP